MSLSPQDLIDSLPHARALAMRFDGVDDGRVHLSMPYDPRLIGDPATGVLHGGAVYALLDTACGLAMTLEPGFRGGTATLDLRVDYMRPAIPGQRIRATAFCYNMTRSVAFVRATATDDDNARPVAMASGAFTNESREQRAMP